MYFGYALMIYNFFFAFINFIRSIHFFFNDRKDIIKNDLDEDPKHVFYKWQMIVGPWSETVTKGLGFLQGYLMVSGSKTVVKQVSS
jgi:hypothetical protein